ncbi:class I SAM-dependent methyltransferase [Ktedonosporobacter rubrisoli]|uniref:Class I SAM-dependent methyltransferase n=1 Tax=Ktedonosporobacter rubrisoli TaxID=2509675 RepID=A0A4P6JKZ3_KTERU|nr:class I SAM-dependent methyltransferase [Ktedonosporobacter rubrisoli]QBD75743.1 class I SAM-dependent methyltransferase [Ktedonosporobacter rubrisoli]
MYPAAVLAETRLPRVHHPIVSKLYERLANRGAMQSVLTPLRQEVVGQARGRVLEIGVGPGLNFPFYNPEHVDQVDAVEPDETMLRYAHERAEKAHVPITLLQTAAEVLPFTSETFDSAVATLVFCSVFDPARVFREIRRVLKPDGKLLLIEHVRATGHITASIQDFLVPVTTCLSGNCHWNRDTLRTLSESGFSIEEVREHRSGLLPIVSVQASYAQ